MPKVYKTTKAGGFESQAIGFIPNNPRNADYKEMMKEVALGGADIVPYSAPASSIADQMITLELSITPRNIRSALLGDKYAIDAITSVEAQITALRAQL